MIDASNKPVFMEFLANIANSGCGLATVPSVLYEFKRGAKNFDQIKVFDNIVEELDIQTIAKIEDLATREENQVFSVIYNIEAVGGRKEKGPSYTDSLLCLAMYAFRHTDIKLLTTNYKDVPLSLFNRDDLIIYDTGKEVRTAAIYTLSQDKLEKRLERY